MLAVAILILFISLGITGCGSWRGAPFVNVTVIEQPPDDEVAVRRAPLAPPPARRPYR